MFVLKRKEYTYKEIKLFIRREEKQKLNSILNVIRL